jgi:hypothetical protein
MSNKRQTWGERREKKRKENFIGRREYLETFSKDFGSSQAFTATCPSLPELRGRQQA